MIFIIWIFLGFLSPKVLSFKLNSISQLIKTNLSSIAYIYDYFGVEDSFLQKVNDLLLLKNNFSYEFELIYPKEFYKNIRLNYNWVSVYYKLIQKQREQKNIFFVFLVNDLLNLIEVMCFLS